jgi:hypothetical protein
VTIQNGVFWEVTPCGSCKNRRFRGAWRLLHQGGKNQWLGTTHAVTSNWRTQRRFITVFTRALHLYLSSARAIQSTTLNPISKRSILMFSIHLYLGLPSGLYPSGSPTNNLYTFLSHSCHMSLPPHHPRLYNSNYTLRRVQIMKLLITQFSPPSRHSIKYYVPR